ncbi:MAG: UPF0149 family protein [Endozoicomonas sp. (ex Botrylloides leachii)]|nr:UPF0149 family protein [Endozoicomonas sp. (ex Botrylloides leachii)]
MSNERPDNKRVSFDQLADQFVEMGCNNHPSEIHGLLCGQLAAGLRLSEDERLQQLAELSACETFSSDCKVILNDLYTTTLSQLKQQASTFLLLVPDEDEALPQQVEALAIWCTSFLSGFGEGSLKHKLSKDAEEILKDLSEIAQIQSDIDSTKEAERHFLAISEYVRTTVMVIFLEINRPPQPISSFSKTIH